MIVLISPSNDVPRSSAPFDMIARCRLEVALLVATLLITELASTLPTESILQLLSDHCLRCLCAASSDCRPDARCRVIEPDTYLCGPFRLNEAYWSVAGGFTPKDSPLWRNNPLAFEMCALDLQCSIKSVLHYIYAYLERCRLLHIDLGTKCMLAAFVHYRAVYLGPEEDQTTPDYYYDDGLHSDQPIAPLSCHLNSSNLSDELAHLLDMAPAARSDDNYWRRFDECSQDTVIDCGLSLGPVAQRKASPRFARSIIQQ